MLKKLLFSILIISMGLAQELEVEGDLKVTGTVESTTIDSMQAVIDSLNAKINSLHGGNRLETRMYELPRFNFDGETEMSLDLSEITGYDLDYCLLKMVHTTDSHTSANNTTINLRHYINLNGETSRARQIDIYSNGNVDFSQYGYIKYIGGQIILQQDATTHIGYVDIILSVTAQFPD